MTDPRDVGKPWDPNLSELERVEARIRYRAMTGQDKVDCQFGPVDRRISKERLRDLFGVMQSLSLTGAESWELLEKEPDDLNAAPVSITIPAEDGPNCPNGEITAQLFEERRRLIAEEARTSQRSAASAGDQAALGSPVVISVYDPNTTDLQRTEAIMRHRAAKGLDLRRDCYYGPVQWRGQMAQLNALLKQSPDLSGEEYWRWLNAQPQDPKLPAITIVVRSGTLPDCPAGDVDERLRNERDRLRKEQSPK